jgi:hypothetical protein
MFVPIDLLKPILSEMVQTDTVPVPLGRGSAWWRTRSRRLIVTRLTDGPAEQAGLKAGDIIPAVGRDAVRSQAGSIARYGAAAQRAATSRWGCCRGIDGATSACIRSTGSLLPPEDQLSPPPGSQRVKGDASLRARTMRAARARL